MSLQVVDQLVEEEEIQQEEVEAAEGPQTEPTWGDLSAVEIFDILVKVHSFFTVHELNKSLSEVHLMLILRSKFLLCPSIAISVVMLYLL